jgi:hypothetical protein
LKAHITLSARLTGHVLLPGLGVLEHRAAAVLVEALDPVLGDGRPAGDAELLLRLHLGGQAVAVPAEAALHPPPAQRLVARDHVLHVAGEEVPVVGQAVGEGRAVVADVLVAAAFAAGALLHRGLEDLLPAPEVEDLTLDLREAGSRLDLRVGLARRGGAHRVSLGRDAGRGNLPLAPR